MSAVELTHVSKAFRDTLAVDDLSLNVPRGSIYGFIGPNGSGKTTTLRMILHILRPDRGSIRVFGSDLRSAVSGRVGYLPEERGLYKRMRVRPMLRFYGELKAGRRVDREVESWLQQLDLIEHADKKIERSARAARSAFSSSPPCSLARIWSSWMNPSAGWIPSTPTSSAPPSLTFAGREPPSSSARTTWNWPSRCVTSSS
jgi:ABC-type transport system involved in cytochrome c biogenesis ATPase subunit